VAAIEDVLDLYVARDGAEHRWYLVVVLELQPVDEALLVSVEVHRLQQREAVKSR
jgi:hypothetical protein